MIARAAGRLRLLGWCASGLLLWTAFPPAGESANVFFALAPLLWATRRLAPRAAFWRWTANALVFWIATLSWMVALSENGGPLALVLLGWAALSGYCAIYFGLSGWLLAWTWSWARGEFDVLAVSPRRRYGRRLFALWAAEPLVFAGFELLRARLFGGFSWNQLGVPLAVSGLGAPAALGGLPLLTCIVVLVNGTVASIVERVRPEGTTVEGCPRRWRALETAAPLAAIAALYWASPRPPAVAERLTVGLVQRNFPCVFKPARAGEEPLAEYRRHFAELRRAAPDVVVLSESALAELSGSVDSPSADAFAVWALGESGARTLVAGGGRTDGEGRMYNSCGVWTLPQMDAETREGASYGLLRALVRREIYDKVHLVPFGEFIPGDRRWPWLQRFAPVGSCVPGEPKTVSVAGAGAGRHPAAVAICFEDTDSALLRREAKRGARIVFAITNDSWFSESVEALQHAWQAVARAIETGLPVVRAGNSGVTGVILPDGGQRWLRRDGRPLVDAPGVMAAEVPLAAPDAAPTPYVRWGDGPFVALFLLLVGTLGVIKYSIRYEKRRYLSM